MSLKERGRNSSALDGDYKKDSSLAKNVRGSEYQIKVQCLAVIKAHKANLPFKLLTELKPEDDINLKSVQFNDCIFCHSKNEETIVYCVEAKHRLGESRRITPENLLNLPGPNSELNKDFSLQRYFDSYRKIKEDENVKNANKKYFFLYTPLDLDLDERKSDSSPQERQMKSVRHKKEDIILRFEEVQEENIFLSSRDKDKKTPTIYKLISNIRLKGTQQEVEEFFKNFRIYVNQPTEGEFDAVLKREISTSDNKDVASDIIDSLLSKLRDWTKDTEGNFFTNETATNIISEVVSKRSRTLLKELSETCLEKTELYKMELNVGFDGLNSFLEDNECVILNIISSHSPLGTSLKVQQALNQSDHPWTGEWCLLHSSALRTEKHTRELKFVLSSSEPYLVLIVCDEKQLEERIIALLEKVYKTLREQCKDFETDENDELSNREEHNRCTKKLILVTHAKHIRLRKSIRRKISLAQYSELNDEEGLHFQCLAEVSREKILKKQVNFQGTSLSLREIVDDNCLQLINEDALVILTDQSKSLVIGKAAVQQQNTVPYYVKRTLFRNNSVRAECLWSTTGGILAVSCDDVSLNQKVKGMTNKKVCKVSDDKHNLNGEELFLLDKKPIEEFKELCEKFSDFPIHWLHFVEGYFFWQKSYKSSDGILKFLEDRRFEFQPETATSFSYNFDSNGFANVLEQLLETPFQREKENMFSGSSESLSEFLGKRFMRNLGNTSKSDDDDINESLVFPFSFSRSPPFMKTPEGLIPRSRKPSNISFLPVPEAIAVPILHHLHPFRKIIQSPTFGKELPKIPLEKIVPDPNVIQYPVPHYVPTLPVPIYQTGNESKRTSMTAIPPIIIVGEAGMGKSTLLKSIAKFAMQETKQKSWVLLLNSNDVLKEISIVKENDSVENIIEFLCNSQGLHDNIFAKKLLRHFCLSKQVTVLVDGFDEIPKENRDKVCFLLKQLDSLSSITLWVTTRPHLRKDLENLFCTSSFELKDLDKEEQEINLKRVWKEEYHISVKESEKHLDEYVEKIVDKFSTAMEQGLVNLLRIPLHVKLVAAFYADNCKSVCERPSSNDSSIETVINVFDLYKHFIESKYSLFVEEKSNIPRDNPSYGDTVRIYEQANMQLAHEAVLMLFPNEESLKTISEFYLPKEELPEEILCKLGIINKPNETVEFVHRSFAEYFVAKLFSKVLMGENKEHKVDVVSFLETNMNSRNFGVIRLFLDFQLSPYCDDLYKRKEVFENLESLSEVDCLQRTVIHLAAYHKSNDVLDILVKKFPNYINKKDIFGETPLQYAVQNENWQGALLLAENEANVTLNEDDLVALFHEACKSGKDGVVSRMLNAQSEKQELLCSDGFLLAVKHERIKVVKNIVKYGRNFLSQAYEKGDRKYVIGVKQKIHTLIANTDSDGRSPIHLAADNGNMEIAENIVKLIKGGAEFDVFRYLEANDNDGNSPFHLASKRYHSNVVKLLLHAIKGKYNASDSVLCICQKNYEGKSPLYYALEQEHGDNIVKIYMKEILDNAKNTIDVPVTENLFILHAYVGFIRYGKDSLLLQILHFLSENREDASTFIIGNHSYLQQCLVGSNGSSTVMKTILNYLECNGKDTAEFIKKTDNTTGLTLLHYCAWNGNVDTLKVLLEYIRKWEDNLFVIEKNDTDGHSALSLAIKRKHNDIVELLLTYVKECGRPLHLPEGFCSTIFHEIASTGNKKHFELLCECVDNKMNAKAFLIQLDKNRRSPLSIAAEVGDLKLVKFILQFIERGGGNPCAALEQKDVLQRTSLHWAVISRNVDLINYLINFISENGGDPLHLIHQRDATKTRLLDFKMPEALKLDLLRYIAEHSEDL